MNCSSEPVTRNTDSIEVVVLHNAGGGFRYIHNMKFVSIYSYEQADDTYPGECTG